LAFFAVFFCTAAFLVFGAIYKTKGTKASSDIYIPPRLVHYLGHTVYMHIRNATDGEDRPTSGRKTVCPDCLGVIGESDHGEEQRLTTYLDEVYSRERALQCLELTQMNLISLTVEQTDGLCLFDTPLRSSVVHLKQTNNNTFQLLDVGQPSTFGCTAGDLQITQCCVDIESVVVVVVVVSE